MPALVLGLALFGLGIYMAIPQPAENQFTPVLDEVALYLVSASLDKAQDQLKQQLEPHIDEATKPEKARYQVLWADLIYRQQRRHGWNKPENHQRIISHYQKAQELGATLSPQHMQQLAETLVALNRDDEAMRLLDEHQQQAANRRYRVTKRIIQRRQQAGAKIVELTPLLLRFEDEVRQEPDPAVRRVEKLWAATMKAQGFQEADEPDQVIQLLQRRLIQFMAEGGDADLAPLWILLGQAYQNLGQHDQAKRWYMLAQQKLTSSDPLNADVLVGLGQIELAQTGDVRAALELFSEAERDYPTSQSFFDALLGRGDCEARLGAHPESIERLARGIRLIHEQPITRQQRMEQISAVIASQYDVNTAREDFRQALEYLDLLRQLHQDKLPSELIQEFARTYERLAGQRVRDAQAMTGVTAQGKANEAKRVAFQEAATYYGRAGDAFLDHAHVVTQVDDDQYGRSLWSAASSYDDAQMWDRAIKVYAEFVKARPGDPRQLEAISRLGVAYLSDGQYQTAADLFQQLVEQHGRSPEAYRSLVPLARSHIALQDFDSAQRVLRHVLTDHPSITPDSIEYQQALIESGKLMYRQRQFEPAIEQLTEATDRYGESEQGPTLRFMLADAYRQSVDLLDEALGDPMSRSRQAALRSERAQRLQRAMDLFARVVEDLEDVSEAVLLPLEKLNLRNAYVYRADCAYDLGQFDQAITLFDAAARRWDNHPASLVALVQIVNAYCEMGKLQEAKVANDRARWQLNRIPDEAFEDPSLPMTREHWQDWLRWTSELNLFDSQAQQADASPDSGEPIAQ